MAKDKQLILNTNIKRIYKKIKEYKKYILYQVYIEKNNKLIPVYRECINKGGIL